ncbi:hypothetical protein AK812_SmicGene31589 [Symbiodinium microadriaticum]|uniref:Uncharacterized protein n=1 Tax=Symbiodinium microadriaticum TaxID=2951 RepID=A0A1Q9CWC0_SYMMI|nr:hypothetical protein AK812_SmicGene31589 [Symbiodinium microadriaticum]
MRDTRRIRRSGAQEASMQLRRRVVSRERNSQAGEYATEEWGLCELAMRPDRGLEVVRGHNDGLCVTFQESRGLRRGPFRLFRFIDSATYQVTAYNARLTN